MEAADFRQVHHGSLPFQRLVWAVVSERAESARRILQPGPHVNIIRLPVTAADHAPAGSHDFTCPPLAHFVGGYEVGHGIAPRRGVRIFFLSDLST